MKQGEDQGDRSKPHIEPKGAHETDQVQPQCDHHRLGKGKMSGGQRTIRLARMMTVVFSINEVIEQVGPAGQEAEENETHPGPCDGRKGQEMT